MINRISEQERNGRVERSVADMASDMGRQVMQNLKTSKLETVVREHPGAVLAVGLAAGILLGWWVKRR